MRFFGTGASKSMRIIFLLAAFTLLLGRQGICDDKGRYEAARQVVDISYNPELMIDTALQSAVLPMKESFEANPDTRPYADELVKVSVEVLYAFFIDPDTQEKMKEMMARVYLEEFTEQELNDLLGFYKTATGKKTIEKTPVISEKLMAGGASIGSEIPPKYMQMLYEKINALQESGKLPK